MNWVPLLFFDDVCHRLQKPEFDQVSQLSGSWSKFGAEHDEKRREFGFRCRLSDQEVSYDLRDNDLRSHRMTLADLNLEFDRITYLTCESAFPNNHRVSLREFERVVAPLVTNCSWPYLAASAHNRIYFNAFKNCPGFNSISVEEQGEESRDFVARQVRLGNVQRLYLYGTDKWPEAENLAETLKIFVSSARFDELYCPDLLRDEYELFELFLERAVANELKQGACISAPGTNLDKSRLLALHPECRHDSEKDEWRIPDSNLRIALSHRATGIVPLPPALHQRQRHSHFAGMLEVELKVE